MKNTVDRDQSGRLDFFTVHDVGSLKGAFTGRGILYSWIQGVDETARLNYEFILLQTFPAEYTLGEQDQITVESDPLSRFPCSGIITATGEGYIIAPAIQLKVSKGQNIVLMVLSPRISPHSISVEKNVLAIPREESTVTVTTGSGEVRCLGIISGRSKVARIILNRNPHLPVYRAGFNETLRTLKGKGRISTIWKPVARNFEEVVMVFNPSRINPYNFDSLSFDKIANHLGVSENKGAGQSGDYVLGDGDGVKYTLLLKLDRGLRKHALDKTTLTVK